MKLPNYWFRSAITGRFVSWAFAQKHKAETVQETWGPPTVSESSAKTVNFTAPNPYPFPTPVTRDSGTVTTSTSGTSTDPLTKVTYKAQIRCPHCDKLTPIDAACRWCQSELDDGSSGVAS